MSRLAVRIIVACAFLGSTFPGRPIRLYARELHPLDTFVPKPRELDTIRAEFKAELAALEPALSRLGKGQYAAADHEELSRGLAGLNAQAGRFNAVVEAYNRKWREANPESLDSHSLVLAVEGVDKAVEAERRLWERVQAERVVHAASTKRLFEALRSIEFSLIGYEQTYDDKGNPRFPYVPEGLDELSQSIQDGLKADDQRVLTTRLAAAFDGGGGGADGTGPVAAGAPGAPRRDSLAMTAPQAARSLTQALDGKGPELPAAGGGKAPMWSVWGLDDMGQSARRAWTAVLPDSLAGAAAPAYAELARGQRERALERSVQASCAWLEREGVRADAALLDECRGTASLPPEKRLAELLSLRPRLEAALDAGVTARVEARAMAGEASAEELEALKTEKPYFEARAALAREVTGNRAVFAAFADGTVFSAAELGLAPGKAPSGSVVKGTWRGLPGFKTAAGGFESLDGSVTVETTTAGGKTRELVHSYDGEKIKIAVQEDGKELGATIFAPDKERPGLFASHDAASRWPETVGRFVDGRFEVKEVVNEDGSLSRPLPGFPEVWVNVERTGGDKSWTFDTRGLQGQSAEKRIERIVAVCQKFMGVEGDRQIYIRDIQLSPSAGMDDELLRKKAKALAALIFDFADAGEPVTLDLLYKSASVREQGRRVVGAWNDGRDARNKRWGLTAYGVREGKVPTIIAHYMGWNDRDVFRESAEDNFDSVLAVVAFGYQITAVDWIYHQKRDPGNGLKWKTAAKEKVGEKLIFDGPGILGHVGNTVGTAAKGVVDVAAGVIAAAQIVNPGYYATVKAVGGEIDYTEMPKRAWSNFAGNAIVRTWFDQEQLAKIGVDDKIALRNVRAEMTSLGQPLTGAVLSAGVSFADNTVMMIPTVAAFNVADRLGQAAGLANTTKLVQGGAAAVFTYQGGSDLVSSTRGFLDARKSFDPADPASKARYYDSVEHLLASGGNMALIVGGVAHAKFAKTGAPAVTGGGRPGPWSPKLAALDATIPGGLAKLPGGTAVNRVLGMTPRREGMPVEVADEAIQAWLSDKAKSRALLTAEDVAASNAQRARVRKLAERPKGETPAPGPATAAEAAQRRVLEIYDEARVGRHLRALEAAQKGKASFRGGHRMDALLEGFLAHEHVEGKLRVPRKVQIDAIHENPDIKGSYLIKYREEGIAGGKPSGSFRNEVLSKTIYDPAVISDEVMMRWGKEAVLDAVRSGKIPAEGNGSTFWQGRAKDGTLIEGWLRNGKVETFWPAYESPLSIAAEAAPAASRTQRNLWETKLRDPRDQMSFDDILDEVRRVGPENVRGVPHWGSAGRQAGPDCAIQALYGQLKPFYLAIPGGAKRGYYDFFNLLRWSLESPKAGVTDGLRVSQLVKFYEAVLGPDAVRNGEVRAMRVTQPSQFEALGNDVHIGILSLKQGEAHAVVVDGAIKTPKGWDVYIRDSNLGGRVKIVYTAQELISLDLKLISVRLNPEAVLANLERMQKDYALWKAVHGNRGEDFPLIGSDAELRAASGGRGAAR